MFVKGSLSSRVTRAGLKRALAEDLPVGLFMIAHEEGVSDPHRWRAQGAARPTDGLGQRFAVRARRLEVQDLFALGDHDALGLRGELKRLFSAELLLVRDDKLGLRDVSGSQELLGSLARRSALTVIVPIDARHGGTSCVARSLDQAPALRHGRSSEEAKDEPKLRTSALCALAPRARFLTTGDHLFLLAGLAAGL